MVAGSIISIIRLALHLVCPNASHDAHTFLLPLPSLAPSFLPLPLGLNFVLLAAVALAKILCKVAGRSWLALEQNSHLFTCVIPETDRMLLFLRIEVEL